MLKQTIMKLGLSLLLAAFLSDIVAFILMTSMTMLSTAPWAMVIFLIINLLIYTWFIYSRVWQEGSRDPNRIKFGHMNKFLGKGLVAGLLADIPFVLFYLITALSSLFNWHYTAIHVVYVLLNMQFNYLITLLSHMPGLFFIFLIPLPLIAGVGYILGFNHISLYSKLVYKPNKTK
ncbi:MAG: hypothetical protein P4L75_04505 [Clostridia bacterium]|nr:hypothetical protein [Clostridia bacterium]MDR3645703.1 hypothetical protein [Clostridia bacterium]